MANAITQEASIVQRDIPNTIIQNTVRMVYDIPHIPHIPHSTCLPTNISTQLVDVDVIDA
jgi:hypothetical protein